MSGRKGRKARVWLRSLQIREAEELLLKAYREGHIKGTVHTCLGQEAIPSALATSLASQSMWFSNHRGHGHFLARTGDFDGLFREILGREGGASGGLGGSQHIYRMGEFLSNGILGAQAPIAVGFALGRQAGRSSGAVVFIGDGSLGEGAVYEAWNLASIFRSRTLFVLEDNGIAQSTPTSSVLAGDIRLRALGFGVEVVEASTKNLDQLLVAVDTAAELSQAGRPVLLHVRTWRIGPHSKGDDNRPGSLIEEALEADALREIPDDLEPKDIEAALAVVRQSFDMAIDAPRATTLDRRRRAAPPIRASDANSQPSLQDPTTLREALGMSLDSWLLGDQRRMLIGEDVEDQPFPNGAPYGGAFKVTRGLSTKFPDQVHNTPISEAGIVGLGIGRSLAGYPTTVEIMFGDFVTLAIDQILNSADKYPDMFGQEVPLPLTIRTPMGGYAGYGPTHSGTIHGLMAATSNWIVSSAGPQSDLPFLLRLAEETGLPHLIVENKSLYGSQMVLPKVRGFDGHRHPNGGGTAIYLPQVASTRVYVLCEPAQLINCLEAGRLVQMHHEIGAFIICPTQVKPLPSDILAIASGEAEITMVIVDEGTLGGGMASWWAAELLRTYPGYTFHLSFVTGRTPIPAAGHLEAQALPDGHRIAMEIVDSARRAQDRGRRV